MGHLSWRGKANSPVLALICCITMVFIFSCTSGGGGSGDSSETGSVSFGLAIDNADGNRSLSGRALEDDAVRFQCSEFDISTIEAEIRNANGEIVALGGPYRCEAGEGSIEDVTPGDNYTVFIFARDSGDSILFEGESEPFAVVAGELTDAGLIVLEPINARLSGDFGGTGFGADNRGFIFDFAVRFAATFLGDGTGNYSELANSIDSPGFGTIIYDLSFDGSLVATLTDDFLDVSNYNGILSPDNNILAVADTEFGYQNPIEIDVGIKRSNGLTNSILNDEYTGARISSGPSTALISYTFNGDGSGTFGFLAPADDSPPEGFQYIVDPDGDGELSIIEPNQIASQGIVSGDGAVVSLVDTEFGGDFIDMAVLIKNGSGLSAADIEGEYIGVGYGVLIGDGPEPETTVWSITADGIDNIKFAIQKNSNGSEGTLDTSYTVEPNGLLRIELPDDQFYSGAVSENGDIFTFVDTNDNDNFIEMGVAIKKTQ
ncbi:MAG: hypothetical protein QNJ58_23395 [Desulfobacterales bacterium]|nr:hypothetical protein [Desulfobacterales bacterium]